MTTADVEAFLEPFSMLMMASLSLDGSPHASTAPFVRDEGHFYLLISTVAQHGRNLLNTSRVSLLFAEDEAECANPFGRRRITVDAEAAEVARDASVYPKITNLFAERFGSELIETLSGMADFHLFRLSPLGGSAVMGFGKAYRLNTRLEIVDPIRGHHQPKERDVKG